MKLFTKSTLTAIPLFASIAEAGTYTLTGAAASTNTVPTLGEWGAIFMTLAIISTGMYMLNTERKPVGFALFGAGLIAIPILLKAF